ncbi:uncharacterized protein [Anoplolepis gracilipes]|uniref:uncharacterized protein n=1 Tax=Anoplolepis gracilipes TaxID=354296 RepID=UPI003BA30EBB
MDSRIERILVIIAILIAKFYQTHGIIGYDCGSPSANLTTLSLLTIDECDIPQQNVSHKKVYIQLLQINEFKSVRVIQCKVEIDRIIKYCGMFSHTSDVHNGKYAYIKEISRDACRQMHDYGSIQLESTYLSGLKPNQTQIIPLTLAGKVDTNGNCKGESYSDFYGTWSEVIVLANVKITLQDYIADVRINSNRVQLRSGVICEFNKLYCTDVEGGDTYWDYLVTDMCQFSNYGVLYEGDVNKVIDNNQEHPQTVYSVATQNTIFALTIKETHSVCGYSLIRTEHPKLLIFETKRGLNVFKRNSHISNLDIFTYMNSKFVYVERHIRIQINDLYRNILLHQCNLERQILQNALAIATQSSDIFAYYLMKGPGYMALRAGEVIHITKCIPVDVKVARTKDCYNELPVIRDNKMYFLTPQTHILLRQGTQTTCNPIAPAMYLLGDSWYKLIPNAVETIAPTIMKPLTKPTWKYISPGSLSTSGIYSEQELKDLRDHIMFPVERPSVLNTVARRVIGKPISLQKGSISNLLDDITIKKVASSAWEKVWGKFLIFGNISAGLIGIYLIIQIIKLIVDTIVNGYALHTVYGWSIHLLGAIWDSVTYLLLHLGTQRRVQKVEYKNIPEIHKKLQKKPEVQIV